MAELRSFHLVEMILLVAVTCAASQSPTVTVTEGIIVGKTVNFDENRYINVTKRVDVYQGVPYADPPDRFQPPGPKTPWTGELDATAFGPACHQAPSFYFPNQDEDCLYLNVYTPNPRPSGAAVMVWIHGGGFSSGSAMVYDWYGAPLVAVGDVIVVTVNYRLGVFAKFTTKDAAAPGNIGMLDQVAALEWVKTNIQAFGGDPNQVTIFGESAGAAAVSFHLLSKLSRGLFSQAILQSGSAFSPWAFADNSEKEVENAYSIGRAVGCDVSDSSALVACLEATDAGELWAAADRVYMGSYPVTVDSNFLEDTPEKLYSKGDFSNATLLAGFNKDEGTFYTYFTYPTYATSETPPPIDRTEFETYASNFLKLYGYDHDIINEAVYQEYIDWTKADDPAADLFRSAVDFGGDLNLICPTDRVMRAHDAAGDRVYKYFFTHEVMSTSFFEVEGILPFTPWLGAGHAEELIYVWGMPFIDQLYHVHGHNLTDEENVLSVNMMGFWTNFAKTGNPNASSKDEAPVDVWPVYTSPDLRHVILDLELGEGRAVRASQCRFWEYYIPSLVEYTASPGDLLEEWEEEYAAWKVALGDWQGVFQAYKEGQTCP